MHALGAGLTLIEVQQNANATYRLYDYGRPRELHLDEAIAVSRPEPYEAPMKPYVRSPGRQILAEGRAFVLERWSVVSAGRLLASKAAPVWLIPVSGSGDVGGQRLTPGTVWHVDEPASLALASGAELIVAYPGPDVRDPLIVQPAAP